MNKLPDSGKRHEFKTGAMRDASEGKGFPSDIPPTVLLELAKHFEAGAEKYERGNYRKGIPLSRFYDSAMRHLWAWHLGKKDEPHLVAAIWNLVVARWTEDKIENGKLDDSLNDLPHRESMESQPMFDIHFPPQ